MTNGHPIHEPIPPHKEITHEQLCRGLSRWAESQGWPFGCPIPSIGAVKCRLVIAKRAPFGDREVPILSMPELLGEIPIREIKEEADRKANPNLKLINSWYQTNGILVGIIQDDDGKRFACQLSHPILERLPRLIETAACRYGAVTARAEARAMMNLADRLSEVQADSYVLNGSFVETSKRSKVKYIFRKGYPTIAMVQKGELMQFLAALCMHPLAYYENTHCGAMTPSDDVLAHLLFMRADEHGFWKNSNQHPLWDTRSGI